MFKKKPKDQNQRNRPAQQSNSPVFSYYSSRRAEEAAQGRHESRPAPKASWIKQLPTLLAVGAVVVSLAYATFLSTRPQVISSVSPTAATQVNTVDYQFKIQKVLQESIWNRNKLTFRASSIQRTLQARFPELGDIAVNVPVIGRYPVITISPSPATLILTNQQAAIVVDSQGRAIADARQLAGGVNVVTVNDESGLTLEQGMQVIPKDYVDFIATVKYQLDAKNVEIESAVLPRLPNELHVRLKSKPYYIKFNLSADARQQVGALLALQEELSKKSVVPAVYIDLRVDERVFYK